MHKFWGRLGLAFLVLSLMNYGFIVHGFGCVVELKAEYPNLVEPNSSFKVKVSYMNTVGSDTLRSPKFTMYKSTPSPYFNISEPSTIIHAGVQIPGDSQWREAGEFTINVANNTPPGLYEFRVWANYTWLDSFDDELKGAKMKNFFFRVGGDLSIKNVALEQDGVTNLGIIAVNRSVFVKLDVMSSFNTDKMIEVKIIYDFGSKTWMGIGSNGEGELISAGKVTSLTIPKSEQKTRSSGLFGMMGGGMVNIFGISGRISEPSLSWSQTGVDTRVRVIIDPDNKIKEDNENNNEIIISANIGYLPEPPKPPSILQGLLGMLKDPAALKEVMKSDPLTTSQTIREGAKTFMDQFGEYLQNSATFTSSIKEIKLPEGLSTTLDLLNNLYGSGKTSFDIIGSVAAPIEVESNMKTILQNIMKVQSQLQSMGSASSSGSITDLQANAEKLPGVLGEFNECFKNFNALVSQAETLSTSQNIEDVLKFEQTINILSETFNMSSQIINKIHETNMEIIRKIGG